MFPPRTALDTAHLVDRDDEPDPGTQRSVSSGPCQSVFHGE